MGTALNSGGRVPRCWQHRATRPAVKRRPKFIVEAVRLMASDTSWSVRLSPKAGSVDGSVDDSVDTSEAGPPDKP